MIKELLVMSGGYFFGSVSFVNAKEMDAHRRAYDFKIKTGIRTRQ
jgi:hypothetical protein